MLVTVFKLADPGLLIKTPYSGGFEVLKNGRIGLLSEV